MPPELGGLRAKGTRRLVGQRGGGPQRSTPFLAHTGRPHRPTTQANHTGGTPLAQVASAPTPLAATFIQGVAYRVAMGAPNPRVEPAGPAGQGLSDHVLAAVVSVAVVAVVVV